MAEEKNKSLRPLKVLLAENNPKKPSCDDLHAPDKPVIEFLFSNYPENNDTAIVVSKCALVIAMESLGQSIRSFDTVKELAAHICEKEIELALIQGKKTDKEYFELVKKLADDHKIKTSRNHKSKDHTSLLSFASKYCAHHNQIYPFYDNDVFTLLKFWGYDVTYMDYPKYVKAITTIQQEQGLSDFSLRHIESYLWSYLSKMKKHDRDNSSTTSN